MNNLENLKNEYKININKIIKEIKSDFNILRYFFIITSFFLGIWAFSLYIEFNDFPFFITGTIYMYSVWWASVHKL